MMERTEEDDIPDLTERILARFLPADAGWSGDLAKLSSAAKTEISANLSKDMTGAEADEVVRMLDRAFGTAVEIAEVRYNIRQAAGGRKRARKLGVRLRDDIAVLLATLEKGEATPGQICSDIISDRILERLVTPLLEERLRARTLDPLRNVPESAVEYLPDVLAWLEEAIRAGVTTGPVDPAQDFLAFAVVACMERATGQIPGRTWIEESVEETGVGLEVCRTLAAAFNDALPAQCQSEKPADMAKAFRRAIKVARSAG